MIIEKDGFNFLLKSNVVGHDDDVDCISVNDNNIKKASEYIVKNKIKGIRFAGRYSNPDINFIGDFTWLEKIVIQVAKPLKNISVINKMPKLKRAFGDFYLDFLLENETVNYIGCDWDKKTDFSELCLKLNHLNITGCKDFITFGIRLQKTPALKHLELIRGNMVDLKWVGEMKALEKIELHYLPKLETLNGIENLKNTLKEFELCTGRKITDYSPIASLENLESLAIENRSVINDLSFLAPLKKLKYLRIYNTKITAEDISYLKNIPTLNFYGTGLEKRSKK